MTARPPYLVGKTKCGNAWRCRCRRRPSKEPPRTPERSHSPDATHRYDASATVSNNLNVVIDGHDASALVDTGADYSVLSGRLSRRLRKVMTPWEGPQIRTAGGHLITPVGRCTARVEIHGETCPVKFVVLQDCSRDVILGMDFLCEYGAVIDLGTNRLTLRKPAPPAEEPQATSPAVRVLANHVNLPPRSSVFVLVGIDEASCGEVLLEGSLQLLLGRGIGVARGVAELQDGRTVALVTNFRNETQHLTKGAAVGHVEELRNSAEIAAITDESSPPQQDSTSPAQLDIDPKLPDPKRRQLAINTLLLFEVTPQDHCILFCMLNICVPLVLGTVVLGLIGTTSMHWSAMQLVVLSPTLPLLLTYHLRDESPPWLITSWKFKDAERVIPWAARKNGLPDLDKELCFRVKESAVSRDGFTARPTFFNIVSLPLLRSQTLIVFGGWWAIFNRYYSIAQYKSFGGGAVSFYIMIGIANMVTQTVNYFVVRSYGRRKPMSAYFLGLSELMTSLAALVALGLELPFAKVAVPTVFLWKWRSEPCLCSPSSSIRERYAALACAALSCLGA
ncbi:solute carrier family 22 member 2-like [Ixodes scapularis]